MLTVGDTIPSLKIPVQQGTTSLPGDETFDLAATEGKWKVLFYWPKDFTFVCPTEIVGYGKLKDEFAKKNAVLLGASTDTSHVHFAWRQSDPQLAAADFPWLADNARKLAEALGILHAEEGVAYRATFIIDPDNVIQHVAVNALNVGRNPAETLRILGALQTEELTACNWNEGEEVLRPVAA